MLGIFYILILILLLYSHLNRFKILHRFIKDSQEHCSRAHIGIGTQHAPHTSSGTRMTKTSTVCESWFTLVLTAVMMIVHIFDRCDEDADAYKELLRQQTRKGQWS